MPATQDLVRRAGDVLRALHVPPLQPQDSWLMMVRESNLLFASWPVPIEAVRPLVPRALAVSTYSGAAWVTVEALQIDILQFRDLPPLPQPIHGSQLNVRTYVAYNNQPGVHFLSLDCPGIIGTTLGRLLFKLPFKTATVTLRTNGNNYHVESTRVRRDTVPAKFAASVQVSGPPIFVQPDSLEAFLLNHTCLFGADKNGRLFRGDVAHRDRVIQSVSGVVEVNTLTSAAGVDVSAAAPILNYSPGDDSLAWPFVPVETPGV